MPANKENKEYITEADVETKFIYNILLSKILNYPSELVHFHVPVKITQGRATVVKEADVVIENEDNENIIVIDSKAPDEDLEKYFDQIDSYAFALETPISILSNYDRTVIRVYLQGNKKQIVLDKRIDELSENNYKSLKDTIEKYTTNEIKMINSTNSGNMKNKITDYRRLFHQIHTQIRSIDKLDPSASFDEFSKVLFIKIINDIIPENDRITPDKIRVLSSPKIQQNYADSWFQEKVKEFYPGIFASNEKIALSPKALCQILSILDENFDLKDSLTDVKGRAFEEFLPSQLRGKGLGQFFTPRSVVDFMIELADISITDKVLDFASGSGGFLIKAFDKKRQLIKETQQQYLDLLHKTREELLEDTKTQIFGIDAEPRAVRTAKMNMLLWGDGKQIQHGNGLDTVDYKNVPYMAKEFNEQDATSGVDIILANPPFGSTEEDENILKNYCLSKKEKKKEKNTDKTIIISKKEKTENLFIEKAYKMLKPGGKLLIVLPEGIFSNKDSRIRDYILSHFCIDTIVKLPKHSFTMSGVDTINTVILIAKKNTKKRMETIQLLDKKTWINKDNCMGINFAAVNQIGYEPSGKIIQGGYDNTDLKMIADKLMNKDYSEILADPIKYAELEFGDNDKSEAWKKSMIKFLRIEFHSVPQRLDPTYYFFTEETKTILNSFVNLKITDDNIKKIKLSEGELNEDIEKVYKYVSVVKTLDGTITEVEEKTVDDLLSLKKEAMPQKLFKGDIVFNPYRINTGSIIYIDSEEDNLITSPAYVVLRNVDIDARYLVQLLKTPFMKYQIQVLASGSVRDNFSGNGLGELKIPNLSKEEQKEKINTVNKTINKIKAQTEAIENDIDFINKILNEF